MTCQKEWKSYGTKENAETRCTARQGKPLLLRIIELCLHSFPSLKPYELFHSNLNKSRFVSICESEFGVQLGCGLSFHLDPLRRHSIAQQIGMINFNIRVKNT